MPRLMLLLGPIAAVAAFPWLAVAVAQTADTATVVVQVPSDARVYFGDVLTKQTGPTRTFVTPALELNSTYYYTIKAEVDRDGRTVTQTQKVTVQAGRTVNVDFPELEPGAESAADQPAPPAGDAGWPRKLDRDGVTLTIYQPQVEQWDKNRLEARAAVAVETKASPQPIYGIIRVTARTAVDKEARTVTLDDLQLAKVEFPAAADKSNEYAALVRKVVSDKAAMQVSLDRLEAGLAVTRAEGRAQKGTLKNDAPRIIFSKEPALLVLIDGKPALRQFPGTKFLRVINTRALILLDEGSGTYYLRLADRWLSGKGAEGERALVKDPPPALAEALQKAKDENLPVDLLDDPDPDVKAELDNGKLPAVYVSTTPAELIVTQGEPQMAPIDGTKLLYVKNTSAQLLFDVDRQEYYALLSGRWFRSKDLAKGPWEFVPGDKLPVDFAKVPDNHPKGDILASVAGTPQAQESVIANTIPQTARISRKDATLTVTYDGDPKFEPVEGTPLQYAVNTPTPVVQVDPANYYACANGVWFNSPAPAGPWTVATAVPDAVYDIPPSSPIYYVTNTYIYGATPDYVDVGYTPGYFGTCVAPWGGVVWGTGWAYPPWVGTRWFGQPWSYGWGVHFGWTAGGWGFNFNSWHARPWWGPVGWHAGWGGASWQGGWRGGYGGRYNNVHFNQINFNNFNAYNRWGNNAHARAVRNDQFVNRRTVATGRMPTIISGSALNPVNNVYAGRDGSVYRRAEGNWEQRTADGWQRYRPEAFPAQARPEYNNMARLNGDFAARQAAQASSYHFQNAGGFAGTNGGYGGYHGASGFHGGGFRGGRR